MRTASQDAWGNSSSAVGSVLVANFFSMYGGTGLVVGGTNTMTFTASSDVFEYLPSAGPPGSLTFDVLNPLTTSAGELGGQVLALQLNVDFSATFGNSVALGNLRICNFGAVPSLNGVTVGEFLASASWLLGGGGGSIGPATATSVASLINGAFADGTPSTFAQNILVAAPSCAN